MTRSLTWRIVLILLVTVVGLAYTLPSIPQVRESGLEAILPNDKINLGLDLKGGIHLTLGVDMNTALDTSMEQMGEDIRSSAREDNVVVLKPVLTPGRELQLTLLKADQRDALDKVLERWDNALEVSNVTTNDQGVIYTLAMQPDYKRYLTQLTLDQAVQTIRNRIDQFGVSEPDIRKQPQEDRIQVQLPGLQDPERAIDIIGQTAHLQFQIVDDSADPQKAKETGVLPPGTELRYMQRKMPNGSYVETPIVVQKLVVMTGEHITDATTRFDSYNQPYVALTFDTRGAQLFERITGENTQKRMAIVLDGKVYSAPVIQERISGGRASITGQFTVDQARDLAIVLRAGALPAPVTVLEQRTVGPSLGQESIDQGINSALIGGALVLVFMLIYYGVGGLIADLVLVLNIILIMAGLAAFGATLTLPGIAGIILTIGMAVDANVIIFERIREELRAGLTPRRAVEEGYSRATLTILDANITTIIAAIVLYEFGTGPVRGFAVTLGLGIVASLFTAIFVSRVLFDIYLAKRTQSAKLSI